MAQSVAERVRQIVEPYAEQLSLQIWDIVYKKRAQTGISEFLLTGKTA